MDIRIHLDREQPTYTNEDVVSGHVMLRNGAQLDITAITIKLSGSATSRLNSNKLTQSHQLFERTEQAFPPSQYATWFTSRKVTIPPGEHAFPFSIRFPQVSECYKATTDVCGKRPASRRTHHLLRKLPPSSGDKTTPEEIKYFLEATVRPDGILCRTQKATRDVYFRHVSTISHILPSLTGKETVTCSSGSNSSLSPLTCEIEAKLLNGPFLLLGQPISLNVDVIKLNLDECKSGVFLHNFQTMLIETTEVRARDSMEVHTRSCVIQTTTRVQYEPRCMVGSTLSFDDSLWSRHCVPLHLTPTFETCNISRSYKLEIRLGIEFGRNNVGYYPWSVELYDHRS
ncbi:uncharacterized protein EURHEDRAFT_463772 [Aspergillus ruber CBS 135680]|uniref:Arrestin-like N-terminal domain-containing protein n=1 Tax=Aspergillus ruber (strain CBS 135680) TaxID=1388766 RepID=A0A017S6S3_ASPRC|nr:uncharacterized protein EURHEDRAFT_463772 [Aspergillus ruber CBS 135680]EYE91870.1 hypothetical protein EURHEDRAFT_463772 [Aspergillus ruber CBS 135680]